MKYSLVFLVSFLFMTTASMAEGQKNVFLQEYTTPFQSVPFQEIRIADYAEALDKGLQEQRQEIQALIDNPEAPTFANTIEALEEVGSTLDRVTSVLFNLTEAATCDELDELANRYSPILSQASNEIFQNAALFSRVKAVYEQEKDQLTGYKAKLLQDTYLAFVRSGANLSDSDKAVFADLCSQLSTETLTFGQHVLKETNAFYLHLTKPEDVDGLPESALQAAKEKATQKGLEGWVIDLSMPSYLPFMTYATQRQLREQLYMAYNSKGNKGGENDNNAWVKNIVNHRLQVAQLMGETNYGNYKLQRTMAQNNAAVYQLLDQLYEVYYPVALQEKDTITAFAKKLTGDSQFELRAWDWAYYTEKYKEQTYQFSSEELRPYFELNNVVTGVYWLAEQLYGLRFQLNPTLQKYHPDVNVYEVYDESNHYMGLLYTDFFPRDNKRGGAWMTEFRGQWKKNGVDTRPLVSIVMNFTPPTADKPSLLTFDEVLTLLHEFGHALHGLLSDVEYGSQSGTNVMRDFVELPSQLMENFATEDHFLDKVARHFETGERIPQVLVDKLKASRNYLAAYACIRQLSFGYLDMAWHTLTEPFDGNVEQFERTACRKTAFFPPTDGACMSTQFNHLFSGGYAAGYYGYKWAEVLDADAFAVFRAQGGVSREVGNRFKDCILSKGGTEHPARLYEAFKGSSATIDALLERDGIAGKK